MDEEPITAISADGAKHIFPPGTALSIVDAAMKKYQSMLKIKPVDMVEPGSAEGFAKSALTGGANAVTGFAGMPGEITHLANQVMPDHPGILKIPQLPRRQEIKQSIGDITGMSLYQPQTPGEKWMAAGVEGAGSFFNPFNPMAKTVPLMGALSGIGGEMTSTAMPDNPAGRLAGESPFAAIALALMAKKPQQTKMMGDWAKAMGEEQIIAGGERAAADSATLGTKVMSPQAMMGKNPIMDTLLEQAKAHPKGTKIQELLLAQREAVKARTLQSAEDLSHIAPTQEAANEAVIAARKARPPVSALIDQFPELGLGSPAIDTMFTKGMRTSGTGDFGVISKNMDKMRAEDLRTVATDLAVKNPETFPLVVKENFKAKWDAAQNKGDPFEVAKLWRGAAGTEQRARFDVMVEEAAKANKLNPYDAKKAANELMDAVETASQGQGAGRVGTDLRERAGNDLISGVLKSVGINAPFHRLGYNISERNADKVIVGFIDAMTTGDMTKKLIALSKFNNIGHKTNAVARTMLSAGVLDQDR